MPKIVNDNIRNNSPKSLDDKYTRFVGSLAVPYTSISQVNSLIPLAYRSVGLTVLISVDGENTEYWYKTGIADVNLEKKEYYLTTDSTPTEDSSNPITSGGVFDRLVTFRSEIDLVYNTPLVPNLQDVTQGEFNNITDQSLKIGERLDLGNSDSFIKDDDDTLDISNSTDVSLLSGDYTLSVSSIEGIKISRLSEDEVGEVEIQLPTTSGTLPISVNGATSNDAGNIQLNNVSGTFTSVDGKTITITNGIVTSITT